jgi:hypothetical protein
LKSFKELPKELGPTVLFMRRPLNGLKSPGKTNSELAKDWKDKPNG